MRMLLDTHVVFWATIDRTQLSRAGRDSLESEEHEVFVSVAIAWEIAIKVGLGKWPDARGLITDFERYIEDAGFELMPIAISHARAAGAMQSPHRDPFDQLPAAQAMIEGLTLVAADPKVRGLGAPCLW